MRCATLLGVLTTVVLYLVMGALVFHFLEAPYEEGQGIRLNETRQEFLDNYTCVNPENLQALIEKVSDAIGAGIDPKNNDLFISSWDLASAFFFSGTIVTTIGYGNIAPKTEWGQLFCICYALVGIPLFGFLLVAVGDHLGNGLRKAVAKIEMLFLCYQKWKVSPTIVRIISALLSIFLGLLLFVFAPTLIFQRVENWTLLESAYYVVITLTTVGFGDYVAGDSRVKGTDHWYKPLVWFWILLGLAYFASILTMIGNWLLVLSRKTRAELEGLRAHATDWSQNIQSMSVDFRIAGKMDDPFKNGRRKRRHRRRSHGTNQSELGTTGPGESRRRKAEHSDSESYSSYSTTSNSSDSESEMCSDITQTEQVPEIVDRKERKDPILSQPLDYFGENLAYIDESSDAYSGKLHLDPLLDRDGSKLHKDKRRRHRRKKTPQSSPTKHEHREPNGDIMPSNNSPSLPPNP